MIPSKAHFIWIGDRFPWLSHLSILSCLRKGGFDEVHLHFIGPDNQYPYIEPLKKFPEFNIRFTTPQVIFRECGEYGEKLNEFYKGVGKSFSVRANILRYAILYLYGGVYFDCDFIILKSFQSLVENSKTILGTEKILAPYRIIKSANPIQKIILKAKVFVRLLCAKIPKGYLLYRKINFNHEAYTNALIGSERHGDLIQRLIRSLFEINPENISKPYYTGTYLLQKVMESEMKDGDVAVYNSAFFFPVSPIISGHLFRKYRYVRVEDIVFKNTLAIHWYSASFRKRPDFADNCTIGDLSDKKRTSIIREIIRHYAILSD